ncbi:MAG: hypothetical protein GWN56_01465 [Nitrosopumilaceae archaeon]|nr:hypothetical protein [Nitrosopumilaceae archaeon]
MFKAVERFANKLGSNPPKKTVLNKPYLLPENREEMLKMKVEIANEVMEASKDFLDQNDIDFTMKLSDSINVEIEGDTVTVKVNAPYAGVVEYGLAPGTAVNVDALRKWVEGKLGVTDPDEAKDVTWKIFNKIRSEGIKPTRFFKKSINAVAKGTKPSRVTRKKKSKFMRNLKKALRMVKKIRKHIRIGKRYKP